MQIFFSYILLGISLAAPIGPINAAQLDRGIRKGFFHAWMIGLGAVVADGFICLLYIWDLFISLIRHLLKHFSGYLAALYCYIRALNALFPENK